MILRACWCRSQKTRRKHKEHKGESEFNPPWNSNFVAAARCDYFVKLSDQLV